MDPKFLTPPNFYNQPMVNAPRTPASPIPGGGAFGGLAPENPDTLRLPADERLSKAQQLIDLGWPGEFVAALLKSGAIDEFPIEQWSAVKERRYTMPEGLPPVPTNLPTTGAYGTDPAATPRNAINAMRGAAIPVLPPGASSPSSDKDAFFDTLAKILGLTEGY